MFFNPVLHKGENLKVDLGLTTEIVGMQFADSCHKAGMFLTMLFMFGEMVLFHPGFFSVKMINRVID